LEETNFLEEENRYADSPSFAGREIKTLEKKIAPGVSSNRWKKLKTLEKKIATGVSFNRWKKIKNAGEENRYRGPIRSLEKIKMLEIIATGGGSIKSQRYGFY
jgi:hypothetical protein